MGVMHTTMQALAQATNDCQFDAKFHTKPANISLSTYVASMGWCILPLEKVLWCLLLFTVSTLGIV